MLVQCPMFCLYFILFSSSITASCATVIEIVVSHYAILFFLHGIVVVAVCVVFCGTTIIANVDNFISW